MANDKQKRAKLPRYTTPIGVFVYPRLSEPGENYNKDGIEYSTKFRLDAAAAKKIRKDFEQPLRDALAAGRAEFDALPINTRKKLKFKADDTLGTDVYDEATEKPTGEIEIKFARKASGVSKKTGKPWSITLPVFDAKGNPMQGVDIWGGSEGRVTFEYEPYFVPGTGQAGLSRKLVAVQITKLVTKGALSADSYGFGEEDGYEFSKEDTDELPDTAGDAEDGDETPDF